MYDRSKSRGCAARGFVTAHSDRRRFTTGRAPHVSCVTKPSRVLNRIIRASRKPHETSHRHRHVIARCVVLVAGARARARAARADGTRPRWSASRPACSGCISTRWSHCVIVRHCVTYRVIVYHSASYTRPRRAPARSGVHLNQVVALRHRASWRVMPCHSVS